MTSNTLKNTEHVSKGKGVALEAHANKDVRMHEGEASTKGTTHMRDKGHGIKTVMDVEVIAPNRLRFVDNPEPSDPNILLGGGQGNGSSVETQGTQVSRDNDAMEEVVEETPAMRQH